MYVADASSTIMGPWGRSGRCQQCLMPMSQSGITHCKQSAQPQTLALNRLLKLWNLLLHTPGCSRSRLAHRRCFTCKVFGTRSVY